MVRTAAGAFLLLIALSIAADATIYRDPKCKRLCTEKEDFELPLPPEPEDDETTRANKWGIVMLNQIKDNIKIMTPPGVARTLAIFATCVHDGAALASKDMNPAYSLGLSNEEIDVDEAVDGAAFEALSAIWGDLPSFQKAIDFLESGPADSESHLGGSTTTKTKTYVSGSATVTSTFSVTKRPFNKGVHGGGSVQTDSEAFLLGQTACQKVLDAFLDDGFDARGNAGPDIIGNFPGHRAFNLPQTTPGITDCPVEMRSLDRWQPLCVPVAPGSEECNVQEFLAPFADKMKTFGLQNVEEVRPAGPPLFEGGDREEWIKQARDVVLFSQNLTDVTKITAEHWADGPDSTAPPGHWFRIAMEATVHQDLDIFETARVLFLVGNSLNDAGVAAWDAKIFYDSIRPLQMIQCGFADELLDAWIAPYMGVGDVPASEWQPYQAATFVTPAFAGYVSGHSTFSAAAAGALTKAFGVAYVAPKCRQVDEGESLFETRILEGESRHVPGLTDVPNTGSRTTGYAPGDDVVLCWDTWQEASVEAGISRLMGGIHIIADHIDGEEIGFTVADKVYEKANRLLWS